MATAGALRRSSRHRYQNVKERGYGEETSKTRSSLFEQAQTHWGSSVASPSVSSSSTARANFLMRLGLCAHSQRDSLLSHPSPPFLSFLRWNPEPSLLLSLSPLLRILSLLLSLSPSASYSCCHPHRTSQKCADSGCWATLPYYWSFKWKPRRGACDWSVFQRGGAAAMLYDHTSLYTCFV